MKKYRIYIDETGNSDLKSSNNPNHRFLTLTGVILHLNYVREILHPDMESIKRELFHQHPDEPIIFHRKDIVNKRFPFEKLRDKNFAEQFNGTILKKLNEWDYKIITVLIDKKEHKEIYQTWKYDPYHYCLAVLMERYSFFLQDKNAVGDVMIESRGGKEDMRLKRIFRSLYDNGTEYVDSDNFKKYFTSREIKLKSKSANISGLQLADLIAHPSRREFLIQLNFLKREKEIFGDKIIKIIQNKYYKNKRGKIEGYGMKKLP